MCSRGGNKARDVAGPHDGVGRNYVLDGIDDYRLVRGDTLDESSDGSRPHSVNNHKRRTGQTQ